MAQTATAERFQPVQFGNYVLVSLIGKGGMAEVYKARVGGAAGFEKVVCVKRILRQYSDDKAFLQMFVNEAKVSARLSHPNIVQVYELGELDGEYFMAMEFVNGRDLLRVMRANSDAGPLPPPVGAYIAREMCRALQSAHDHVGDDGVKHPIIHRDVSPQNVMISYDGIVKLVDFGIAKALHMEGTEETRTGSLKGKFAYMAPEQLDGEKANATTDIFAVGVTLHEILTGRRLFKGNSDFDTMVRVKTQPIPPPSALNAQVPAELDRIVLNALARDPSERYPRAGAMARDLEQFCARQGFTAEEMREFMHKLFPNREEIADGVVQLPASVPGFQKTGKTTGAMIATKAPTNPMRVYAFVGAGVVALGGMGGAVGYGLLHRSKAVVAPVAVATRPAAQVAPRPVEAVARHVAPAPARVHLDSEPEGAEITDGPRVLGTTPFDVQLPSGAPTYAVHLAKAGYEDLDYTLRADDKQLTLKLKKRPGSSHGEAKKSAAPDEPKVRTIDDEEDKDKALAPVKTLE